MFPIDRGGFVTCNHGSDGFTGRRLILARQS
jgi:hypothetical protein